LGRAEARRHEIKENQNKYQINIITMIIIIQIINEPMAVNK
jgi:hypothetical protein